MTAVVDPFLGSGSTMAVDKTGRVCGGVELDPLYANVIVRRYESATENRAILRGRRSRRWRREGLEKVAASRMWRACASARSALRSTSMISEPTRRIIME